MPPYVWKTWGIWGDRPLAHAGRGFQAPQVVKINGESPQILPRTPQKMALYRIFSINWRLFFA